MYNLVLYFFLNLHKTFRCNNKKMCATAMEFYDAKTIHFFVFAILQPPVRNSLRDGFLLRTFTRIPASLSTQGNEAPSNVTYKLAQWMSTSGIEMK